MTLGFLRLHGNSELLRRNLRELKKKDEIELKNCDTKSDEAGLQREREKLERENPIRDFFARERMRKRERERIVRAT